MFLGWGISTLLLWLLRDRRVGDTDNAQQASKFVDGNANSIGSPIPVVLGRATVKNPLVSFYGDFRAEIYTEEYGMHSDLDIASFILPLLLMLINALSVPDTITITAGVVQEVDSSGAAKAVPGATSIGSGTGTPGVGTLHTDPGQPVVTSTGGGATSGPGTISGTFTMNNSSAKQTALLNVVIYIIMWLLMQLFNSHLGRTTIQKGFLYYLGWQHIICWTGENFGIRRLWMNVYDPDIKQQTQQGVWGSDNICWKSDNPNGIVAHIDDDMMFGGYDEGGGFIGDVRMYFGTQAQGRDSWMAHQMTLSDDIPENLRGLTPVYPMFFTAVIPTAYIGKQATIPEMWFEVVNYPNRLYKEFKYDLQGMYTDKLTEYLNDVYDYLDKQNKEVQSYIEPYKEDLDRAKADYDEYSATSNLLLKELDEARYTLESIKLSGDEEAISQAQQQFDSAKAKYEVANNNTLSSFSTVKRATEDLLDNYPISKRDEFRSYADKLINLFDNGLWHLGRLGEDLNPAEAIYEIITNDYWGCGYYNIADVDIKSLMKLGVTCEEEGLGVSCLINSASTAGEYINKILDHINGIKFDNPLTGKLSFKLLRKDYKVDELPEFNTSNCSVCNFSRIDWSETVSTVSVDFTAPEDYYDKAQTMVYDLANRLITQSYVEKNIDGTYFTTTQNARTLALTKLLSLAYPLATIELHCNRLGQFITAGDPILINWEPYGISKQVYRVTNVDYATLNSNMITIEAIEDVFGFEDTDYSYGDIPTWTDPDRIPQDVVYYSFIEYPYELTHTLDTFIKAVVAKPSNTVDYYCSWRAISGVYSKTNRTMKWGMVASTVVSLEETYGNELGAIEISVIGTGTRELFNDKIYLINRFPTTYTNTSSLNLMIIDDEIISYSDIVTLPNGNLLVRGLIRGVYDTLPKKHTAYSRVYFLDNNLDVNAGNPVALDGHFSDEILEITTETSKDAQVFDIDRATHYYTKRRTEAPSPMANLQFGADMGTQTDYSYNKPAGTTYSEDISVKFNIRNKFGGTGGINRHIDVITTATMSDNIQYYVKASSNALEFSEKFDSREEVIDVTTGLRYKVDITDFTYSWAKFCQHMGNRLMERNEVILEIGSYDRVKDIYSYDHYEKHIFYATPRIAGIIMDSPLLLVDVQAYADSIAQPTLVEIPASKYIQNTTMTYDDCPLIMVATNINSSSDIVVQNGTRVDLGVKGYRIDGYDSSKNQAIIHEIDIDPEYVLRTNFGASGDTKTFWKYRSGKWISFTPYMTV